LHYSAELVDLAETEGASRKPAKAIEFSPQVTQFFFLYYRIFKDFKEFLWDF